MFAVILVMFLLWPWWNRFTDYLVGEQYRMVFTSGINVANTTLIFGQHLFTRSSSDPGDKAPHIEPIGNRALRLATEDRTDGVISPERKSLLFKVVVCVTWLVLVAVYLVQPIRMGRDAWEAFFAGMGASAAFFAVIVAAIRLCALLVRTLARLGKRLGWLARNSSARPPAGLAYRFQQGLGWS